MIAPLCLHDEKCLQPATIACYCCARPICDRHTRVLRVGPDDDPADRINLELCEVCTTKFRFTSHAKTSVEVQPPRNMRVC